MKLHPKNTSCILHEDTNPAKDPNTFSEAALETACNTATTINLDRVFFPNQWSAEKLIRKMYDLKKESVSFTSATFLGRVDFDKVQTLGTLNFSGASFRGGAIFGDSNFGAVTLFSNATFYDYASFENSHFSVGNFNGARFQKEASFRRVMFGKGLPPNNPAETNFFQATFEKMASFDDARFWGQANFGKATFKGRCSFDSVYFDKEADFSEVTFIDDVSIRSFAQFKKKASLRVLSSMEQHLFGGRSSKRMLIWERISESERILVGIEKNCYSLRQRK